MKLLLLSILLTGWLGPMSTKATKSPIIFCKLITTIIYCVTSQLHAYHTKHLKQYNSYYNFPCIVPGVTNSALDVRNNGGGFCNTGDTAQRLWIEPLRLFLCGEQELRYTHKLIAIRR